VMAGLSSPYVVRCVGGEGVDDTYSLFLEYAPGGSLADAAERNGGRLGDRDVRPYAADVLRGLVYLHERSVVHGDVKPRNVVIGADGRAKVADFGCARAASSPAGRPIGGTPAFMAPEVARGEDQGPAADVWALGCTVVEMATGRAPWSDADDGVLAAVHRIGYTDAVPEVPAWLSAEARHFLACCFARNASDRPTAAQLLGHPFVASVSHEVKSLEWVSPKSTLDAAFWESAEEEEISESCSAAERIRSLACSAFPDWEDCNESGWITVLGVAPSRVSSSAAGVPAVGGGVFSCCDDEQLETEVPLGAVLGAAAAGAGPSSGVGRQESKRCSSAECRVGVLPLFQCVHRLCNGIDLIKLWLTTKFDVLLPKAKEGNLPLVLAHTRN
jgi:mitogen-activated protein kinase kinase kinase 17/18